MSSFQEDAPLLELAPEEDVYHYLLFIIPVEQVKARGKRFSLPWGILLAYTIVVASVFLQGVMLLGIWNSIVLGDIDWQLSVYREIEGCNTGGSLCIKNADGYTCAPPSVQLATRWDELDTNGDGVWTRDEVKANEETLRCKYAVNPVEVFDVFSKMTVERSDVLWVHPDVKAGTAIPKAYFDFAKGDVIGCTYRTADMCPNLLTRGIWDAPLQYNTSPRVGNTIDSALNYCNNLLKPGGYCERLLPSTYAVWKKSSEDQCVGPQYSKVVYEHPTNTKTKSLLAVDYAARQDFKRDHKDLLFRVYKMCIVAIYLLAMIFELKSIIVFATVVGTFPAAERMHEPVETEPDPLDPYVHMKYTIHGITSGHRLTMFFIVVVRTVMLCMLTFVGLMFLEKTMSVLDLLLNGLGLLFIVEISTIMCGHIVNQYLRAELEKIEPLRIPMLGNRRLNRNPALKDFLWCCLLVAGIVATSVLYKAYVIDPTSVALTCACLSEGDTCREANMFNQQFWTQYWNEEVPAVFDDVAALKASYSASTADLDTSTVSGAAPAPTQFHAVKSLVAAHKRHSRHNKHHKHRHTGLIELDDHITEAVMGAPSKPSSLEHSASVSHSPIGGLKGLWFRSR